MTIVINRRDVAVLGRRRPEDMVGKTGGSDPRAMLDAVRLDAVRLDAVRLDAVRTV